VTDWLIDTWLRNARRDNSEPTEDGPGSEVPGDDDEAPPVFLPFADEADAERGNQTDPGRVEPTIDGD
jgi:hypothetical protein